METKKSGSSVEKSMADELRQRHTANETTGAESRESAYKLLASISPNQTREVHPLPSGKDAKGKA